MNSRMDTRLAWFVVEVVLCCLIAGIATREVTTDDKKKLHLPLLLFFIVCVFFTQLHRLGGLLYRIGATGFSLGRRFLHLLIRFLQKPTSHSSSILPLPRYNSAFLAAGFFGQCWPSSGRLFSLPCAVEIAY